MRQTPSLVLIIALWLVAGCGTSPSAEPPGQANTVIELTFNAQQPHDNPFATVQFDVRVTDPQGTERIVPGFWAGGSIWKARYASGLVGTHRYETICSAPNNAGLHGVQGEIQVTAYTGTNTLYQHGPIRVSDNQQYFEHADGSAFLWLADTWWKSLCERMTWAGFQKLTADRKAKGFSAVLLVCGPYPDENMMEERWGNEGGLPYLDLGFQTVNPDYFEYADRRIQHLVDAGIVPVIVGGWGRPQHGGQSTLMQVGLEGYRRHWRNLIARYSAYPVVWIVGGEARDSYGPWSELAQYIEETDPFERATTYHAPGHPRQAISDNATFDFDMVAIGHDGMATVDRTHALMQSAMQASPRRPVLCGEACYERHMQTNGEYLQRHMFWRFMLSGAAGHTYGAAGIWQASVEGDPGITPVYDWTTWRQGMDFPGSAQLGLGKQLLEQYPWQQFESRTDWVEQGSYAAGIPGQVRFVYLPRRNIYNWNGPAVTNLDARVDWRVTYFDPATGRTFDQGTIEATAEMNADAGANSDDGTHPVVDYQQNVPSPQDWVLIFERIKP